MWQLVKFEDTDHIYDPVNKKLNDLPMHELLYLNNHALWGKIYQGYCEDGDFLYFPPATAHRVTTYEKSIGCGGYCYLPTDNRKMEEVRDWYVSCGLDPKVSLCSRPLLQSEIEWAHSDAVTIYDT